LVTFVRALILFAIALAFVPRASSAAQTSASESPVPAHCPIYVHLRYPNDTNDGSVAFFLLTDEDAGKATGSILAWVGDKRYRIPFADALVAKMGDTTPDSLDPTPLYYQFPRGTHIEGAYVAELGSAPCPIWDPLWDPEPDKQYPLDFSKMNPRTAAYWERVRASTPRPAPAPDDDPATCKTPYAVAHRFDDTEFRAHRYYNAKASLGRKVIVGVLLDEQGGVRGVRLIKGSVIAGLNQDALGSVAHVKFAPQIFHCTPIGGEYAYEIDYDDDGSQ